MVFTQQLLGAPAKLLGAPSSTQEPTFFWCDAMGGLRIPTYWPSLTKPNYPTSSSQHETQKIELPKKRRKTQPTFSS